jgi:hypothetical protein
VFFAFLFGDTLEKKSDRENCRFYKKKTESIITIHTLRRARDEINELIWSFVATNDDEDDDDDDL